MSLNPAELLARLRLHGFTVSLAADGGTLRVEAADEGVVPTPAMVKVLGRAKRRLVCLLEAEECAAAPTLSDPAAGQPGDTPADPDLLELGAALRIGFDLRSLMFPKPSATAGRWLAFSELQRAMGPMGHDATGVRAELELWAAHGTAERRGDMWRCLPAPAEGPDVEA